MKNSILLNLCILAFFLIKSPAFSQDFNKITSTLQRDIESNPDDFHTVIIHLTDRISVEELRDHIYDRNLKREDRAHYVINSLYDKVSVTQPEMLDYLKGIPEEKIQTSSIQTFWITNAISFNAKKDFIYELSLRQDIEMIYGDFKVEIDDNVKTTTVSTSSTTLNENLKAINAHKMWELGYTGYGTKVLIIDSGVEYEHPALRQQFNGNVSPYAHSWSAPSTPPFDLSGHGTHVAGIIVGLDRKLNDTIGVAFNAHWMGGPSQLAATPHIPHPVLSALGNLQYALNPDGDFSTVDDMPDAVNNSWSGITFNASSCDPNTFVSQMTSALEAAGIAAVWSAGNSGPEPSTIRGFTNSNFNLISFFSVGNIQSILPYEIAESSSRGPSRCGGEGSLAIKPEVSAPGSDIRSAGLNNTYRNRSGTSMAAPHVAGAVLLLKEAFPYLSGEDILLALYYSAEDLGEPGEDNTYGMGKIDVYAAYLYLIENGNSPVPPLAVDLDLIANSIFISPKDVCSNIYPLQIEATNGGMDTIYNFEIHLNIDGAFQYSKSTMWEGILIPGEVVNIFIDSIISDARGTINVEVELLQPNGKSDFRILNNKVREEIKVISDLLPPTIYTEFVPCYDGESIHHAISNIDIDTSTIFEWFINQVYSPYTSGNSCTIKRSKPNQTLYVRESYFYETGMKSDSLNFNHYTSNNKGLQFDVHQDFILKSLRTYFPELLEEAYFNINIYGPSNFYYSAPFSQNQIPYLNINLNLEIPKGDGYTITMSHPSSFQFMPMVDKNVNFPYSVEDVITINHSISGPQPDFEKYYAFFDWQIVIPICGHLPHNYELMDSIHDLKIISSVDTLNLMETNEIHFDFSAEFTAQSILWDFGIGNPSSFKQNTVKYMEPGIYEVTLTVYFHDDCPFEVKKTIVVINEPLSTKSFNLDNISIYPNPFNNIIYIESTNSILNGANVTISSLSGQILEDDIQLSGQSKIEIQTQDFPPGVYLLTIENNGHKIIHKIVK